MNEEQAEAVSALMDGELAEAPAQRVVDTLLQDPALRRQWARHHEIGDAMRNSRTADAGSLAARVRAALDQEPVPLPVRLRPARPRLRPLAALAASLAVIALLVSRGLEEGDSVLPGTDTVAQLPQTLPQGDPAVGTIKVRNAQPGAVDGAALTRLTWNDPRPQVERRLNGYLLNHNEYLATGVRGMLPYARVVGYDPRN